MSSFDWLENINLMLLATILVALLIYKARKKSWTHGQKILLASTVICFSLDTLWWWQGWHFFWSDWDFVLGTTKFKLTIFLMGWLVSFGWLSFQRLKNK